MFCCGHAKDSNGTDYLCVLDGTNDVVRFVKIVGNYPWMHGYAINVLR